ncbi:MAG TPA: hypothetical protein PLT65_01330 [Bacilli bacterium]|nr:hypothetical protein [Bacilli bacterium]
MNMQMPPNMMFPGNFNMQQQPLDMKLNEIERRLDEIEKRLEALESNNNGYYKPNTYTPYPSSNMQMM